MAYFPTSPLDGASVTVNGILYTYNASKGAWKRAVSSINNLDVAGNITAVGNITAGNITAISNSSANKFYVTDGIYWANGVAFVSSTYSNANVASYLLEGAVIGAGSSNVVVGAITQSESTTTGALVVKGGAGIAGNLFVGGNLTVSNVSYEYREVITTTETVQGNIVAAAGTVSTDTTTGALVVVGGAGISGALNIGNTGDVSANIGRLFLGNASIQANLGAFQTYANTTFGAAYSNANVVANLANYATVISSSANIITTANLYGANIIASANMYAGNIVAYGLTTTGATGNIAGVSYIFASNYVYPNGVPILSGVSGTYSNVNVEAYFGPNIGTLFLGNASTQANLGAFQTYANANIGTLFLGNASTQANLGAYQAYANSVIYSNTNVASYLTLGANIGSGSTTSNLVAAATTTSTSTTTGALVVKGGAGIAGNVFADKFYTSSGIYWSGNGAAYATGGGGGGGSFTASATAPVSPTTGSFWYKTTTDVLYEYINDGTTDYWIDIQTPSIAANTPSLYVGDVFGGNITFSGTITGSVGYLIERANVVASAPPAVTNLDLITAPIIYFTSNTTQNITANIRGNSTVTLNSLLAIGQSSTFVIFVPNATAYYVNTVKIDNTTVTPYWQGGSTVIGGSANSIDIYTFAVLKTADATFKVFASQVKYQNLGP